MEYSHACWSLIGGDMVARWEAGHYGEPCQPVLCGEVDTYFFLTLNFMVDRKGILFWQKKQQTDGFLSDPYHLMIFYAKDSDFIGVKTYFRALDI